MFRTFDVLCRGVIGALMLCAWAEAVAQPWKAPGPTPTVGPVSAGSFPTKPLRFRGETYFTAIDGLNGTGVWKTDGTREGTRYCLAFRNDAAAHVAAAPS